MPRETALYQVIRDGYEMTGGGIKSEVVRNATQDEFNKFMKLHNTSLYPSAQETSNELILAIKENFDIANKNDLTLTRVDLDTADGRHNVIFELASNNNDWHTLATYDEAVLKLVDIGNGMKAGEYINSSLHEVTAKFNFAEGGGEGEMVGYMENTEYQDAYFDGGTTDGLANLANFFDIDPNPSSVKILHDTVDTITILG